MDAPARIVVVGGGIEGLSTALALARRGAGDVVVIERGDLCAAGTGKSSGVVRCHYGVPSLAAMAWRGTAVLEAAASRLEADVGFVQTGYIVGVAPQDTDALAANVAMQQSLGIEVRMVDHDEVRAMWPAAHLEDFGAFAYEPRGGYGDAYQTGQAFAAAARRHGATIRPHTPVAQVRIDGERGVTGVTTVDGEEVGADAVVVAAGPWTPDLCAPLGIDVPVRAQREQILMVDAGAPVAGLPVLSDLVQLQYVRTERSGGLLVGNSDHHQPQFVDPDDYANRADDDYVEVAAKKIEHRFPGFADPALTHSYAGCYDVTPDFNPVMSATPVNGLFVAAGFSGHGYKISPAVGELMADLVLHGRSLDTDVDAQDFRLSRFAEGAPLVSRHRYTGAGQMR